MPTANEIQPEFFIFHELIRRYRRTDVAGVYLAVQAGLAVGLNKTNVGLIMGEMMPPGRQHMDAYCPPIGASGLAFFHFLFHTELAEAGSTDYHYYRFTRRWDGKTTLAYLKTDLNPTSEQFQREYQEKLRKLDKARNGIIQKNEWPSFTTLIKRCFGDKITIVEL
jgi:hypothetical protein